MGHVVKEVSHVVKNNSAMKTNLIYEGGLMKEETLTMKRNREVIRGLFNIIYNDLDAKTADFIFSRLGEICADCYIKYREVDVTKDFDTFIKSLSDVPAEKPVEGKATEIHHLRTIERKGNVIYWTLHADGKDLCHLCRGGWCDELPRLGICAAHWVRRQVERFTDESVRVEILELPRLGGKDYKFKVIIGASEEEPIYDSKTGHFAETPWHVTRKSTDEPKR